MNIRINNELNCNCEKISYAIIFFLKKKKIRQYLWKIIRKVGSVFFFVFKLKNLWLSSVLLENKKIIKKRKKNNKADSSKFHKPSPTSQLVHKYNMIQRHLSSIRMHVHRSIVQSCVFASLTTDSSFVLFCFVFVFIKRRILSRIEAITKSALRSIVDGDWLLIFKGHPTTRFQAQSAFCWYNSLRDFNSSISVWFLFSSTATRFSRHFMYSFFFLRHSRAASLQKRTNLQIFVIFKISWLQKLVDY